MNTLVPILIAMSSLIFLVILPIYLEKRAAKKAKEKQREEERKRIEALNSPERLARRQEMLQRNKLSYGDPIRVTQGYHKSDIAVADEKNFNHCFSLLKTAHKCGVFATIFNTSGALTHKGNSAYHGKL